MYATLPASSETLQGLMWTEIAPWYGELAATKLSPETVAPWLAQWSRVMELIDEALTWLDIACTQDTADEARAERKQRFLEEIAHPAWAADQRLKKRLLDSGLEPQGFTLALRTLRTEADLFSEANLPLLREESSLTDAYLRAVGTRRVVWEGEEVGVARVRPQLQSGEHEQRERAWRLMAERHLADREMLNDLWVRGLRLRQEIARNAGCATYREYRWRELLRLDYTPADCLAFHTAIERVVMPDARTLWERRRQWIGVEVLRPWDMTYDARAGAPMGEIADGIPVLERCATVFGLIDPAFRGYFETMIAEGLCDLEERPAKAAMGYNQHLEARHRPFIFGHARTYEDVISTIFHEAGHAFQVFEMRGLPYLHQRRASTLPLEFAEVASTTLELLGAMHLSAAGICTPAEEAGIRIHHLERFVTQLFPLAARGDAFQHWVYDDVERAMDIEACDQQWVTFTARFLPEIEWSGLEAELRGDWQQVRHFYGWPFYYIEYALAAVGALQVWEEYRRDPRGTVERFRSALALGATRTVPELYAAAGVRFAFDAETLDGLMRALMGEIDALETHAKG